MTENFTARDLIITAFLQLIKHHSFDKITVSKLVQKAGINRSTFYLHFHDKYDLLEKVKQQITNEFLSHYPTSHTLTEKINIEEHTYRICNHVFTYQSFYLKQFQDPAFIHELSAKLNERLLIVFHHNGYATFAAYGTVGYLAQWVIADFPLSIDEAALELVNIGVTNWSTSTSHDRSHQKI